MKNKSYIVTYTNKIDGDCNRVWVRAHSKEDAKQEALSEYWDIDEIVGIKEV